MISEWDRNRARSAVAEAVRKGLLVRQPCVICGATPTDGHHDDYSRPLDVRWLCKLHHNKLHPMVNKPAKIVHRTVSLRERRTIMRWTDNAPMATIYTASERFFRKCRKWGWPLDAKYVSRGQVMCWQGLVPKNAIHVVKRQTLEKRAAAPKRPLPAKFIKKRAVT